LDADSELAFPNAFSPNADGVNDVVLPFNWGLEGYLLRIYNRWGQVVFESTNTEVGWDGTFLGEPQEVGMYKLTATGKGLDGLDYTIVSDLFLVR
jgi:gliding motility-associated-like protein